MIIVPSGLMGFIGPGGAASATIALASSVEIRLGLPVTVDLRGGSRIFRMVGL